MRTAIISFLFFFASKTFAQNTAAVAIKLNEIKHIPCSYQKAISKKFTDNAFNYIIAQDTFAIPTLINLLTDTTNSEVKNLTTKTFYKKADLAFILINYIESVPLALITRTQWCICCDCGYLPVGFLDYLKSNRLDFQKKYKSYFASAERRKSIMRDVKILKKKKSH